ncbi:MAG TPA: hypothetical protein VIC26_04255 [Marinagarivorans sp.]
MLKKTIFYPLFNVIALMLSASCSSGAATGTPDNTNRSASNITPEYRPPSAQNATWRLNQNRQTTSLLLPVYQATLGATPQLTLRISAIKASNSSDKKKTATVTPEHYLTITSTCNEDNSYLKTHTVTTYPLGDEGVFTLQLPALEADCISKKGITHIKTILELVLPGPSKSLELHGHIGLDS